MINIQQSQIIYIGELDDIEHKSVKVLQYTNDIILYKPVSSLKLTTTKYLQSGIDKMINIINRLQIIQKLKGSFLPDIGIYFDKKK